MSETIKSYATRYLIPFCFDYKNDGYSKILNNLLDGENDYKQFGLPQDSKWVKRGFWENYKSDRISQPEMDIYTYLLDILRDDEENDNANLGTSLVLKTGGTLLNLLYVNSTENNNAIGFRCNDLGVFLFKNGVGFVWYDVEFGNKISISEYLNFQHDYKELARIHSEKFIKKTGKDTYEEFCMGQWIASLFADFKIEISFWAERKSINKSTGREIGIPDKSLLFQFLLVDNADNREITEMAFRIANGYDNKYKPSETLKDEVYEPFNNACFYTSKSGSAYVVSDMEGDAEFFENNFKDKFLRDYFFIYVLLLYQTYSAAQYSKLLTRLPAETTIIDGDDKYIGLLESLHEQINLFLVKSTYESVSNIQHQNGTYIYGKKVLRIEEDMKSLVSGLEALRGIEAERKKYLEEAEREVLKKKEQREKEEEAQKEKFEKEEAEKKEKAEQEMLEKKDRALNKGLVIFGFLVVISAAIDALSLVDWFAENTMKWGHWVSLAIIAILTIFMSVVLILNTRRKK